MQNFSPAARERGVQRIELTQFTMPSHHTDRYTGDWSLCGCSDGIRNRHLENSVETSLTSPIPGVPVSMLTGHRELSQLDPLHTARAGGRREILHACSRFIELRLDSYWIHA